MKKFRVYEYSTEDITPLYINPNALTFNKFIKYYNTLLNSIYIFEYTNFWLTSSQFNLKNIMRDFIHYYAKLSRSTYFFYQIHPAKNLFHTLTINNLIVFSKPRRQLFLMFFKKQPIFIFTGGLMRLVMNERRKSSKRTHKVAISLIKLATILLNRHNYMSNCYLKLKDLGQLRFRILSAFAKAGVSRKINYIFIYFTYDYTAQKFPTRRAVKKYIKKRFKLI